ncbi:hypothetical protein Sjap_025095 [Stephania japonica]|uniref:Uncharacterized protein n=1 Tax=Stephania japonica TaxID=461633 RepID=A0AAP0E8W7_9MAGN
MAMSASLALCSLLVLLAHSFIINGVHARTMPTTGNGQVDSLACCIFAITKCCGSQAPPAAADEYLLGKNLFDGIHCRCTTGSERCCGPN